MKNNFKKTLPCVSKRFISFAGILSAGFMVCTMNLSAQPKYKLNQVIVLNDGNRLYNDSTGIYATVGSYNPVTGIYQDFDTIKGATFGSYVLIDSGFIYAGADSLLVKYDLNTKKKIATQTVLGIREMAIWGNQILITRAATFPLTSYFQAYNKNSLSLIYEVPTVSYATQGIQVMNDSAYIAINDFGSGAVGKLGVVDLKGQKEKHEVDLGTNGLNPYEVFAEPVNQKLYTVNNEVYTSSYVTEYDAPSTTFANFLVSISSGCAGSAFYSGNIYFQANNDDNIGLFSTSRNKVWDSLKIYKYIYGMAIDSADGYIYVGQTDYVSYGEVYIYNFYGIAVDSFATGISPGNMAMDVRNTTGIAELVNPSAVNVYPNPSNGVFTIQSSVVSRQWSVEVYNVLGEKIYSQFNIQNPTFNIDLSTQPNGVYFITIHTTGGTEIHKKIVKE